MMNGTHGTKRANYTNGTNGFHVSASSLSNRGAELSVARKNVDRYTAILNDPYDPDSNPNGFINIGTSENYLMLQEVADFINNSDLSFSAKDFSYGESPPWGSIRLRRAMATHINRHFFPRKSIDPAHLLFANGVTSLCELLGYTICDPGDTVLLSRPCYQAFQSDFGLKAKVKCEYVSFGEVDQFSVEGVAKYEEAIITAQQTGSAVKAIILCHPHNPLGRCYPRSTLFEFMKLCSTFHIHLIVDEIYALSVYEVPDPAAVPFESVLSLTSDQYIHPDRVHVLYGMSKDTAAGGIRLGCFHTRNVELMRAMSTITQFHWSGIANERVATLILEDQKWIDRFLQLNRERLAHANRTARTMLDREGLAYYRGANAGFFLWLDLRSFLPPLSASGRDVSWAAENALTLRFIESKVYITDGQSMNAEEPGWFRLIFSQDERITREGLRRIVRVLRHVPKNVTETNATTAFHLELSSAGI